MKYTLVIGLSMALLAGTASAQSAFQKPEDAVKYRQSALFIMGQHFQRVGAMASGRVPFDAAVAQKNMDVVMEVAQLPWAGFTPETRDVRSRAKPNIWSEKTKFDEAGQNALKALTALSAASKTGNLDAVKKTFGDAAASCKACHDSFRE